MTKDRALLASQLQQALAQEEGSPFEIAVLTALLARYEGTQPPSGPAPADLPDQDQIDAAVQRLYDLDGGDPVEERYAALADFDELCAGFWWCGHARMVEDAAILVRLLFESFPADWRDLAGMATEVMGDCRPRRDDPARHVWRALEATRWHDDGEPIQPPPCEEARRRLGLA